MPIYIGSSFKVSTFRVSSKGRLNTPNIELITDSDRASRLYPPSKINRAL